MKTHVKIIKKAEKSKILKKIARPLAYAAAGFLGPAALSAVAKADKVRTAARKVRAKIKDQKAALKEQFAQAAENLGIEPAQSVQEPAPFIEPVEQQAAPEPMVYNEPEEQAQAEPMQASFAPVQQSFAPSPFYPQSNPVTRLPTADETDQPRVVGISATGIMDNIKANPLPWIAGAAVAAYLVTNRKTSHAK